MAVVSVSFDGTILSAAESTSDNGVWDNWNATTNPIQEDNFLFQGAFAQSAKSTNNIRGVEFEDDATVDFATTPKAILAKVMMSTPGTLDLSLAAALFYEIGEGANGNTWTYDYYINGLYAGPYPILKTWRVLMIDPNEVAFRDAESGTPALGTVDYYGYAADTALTSRGENVIHDRLDRVDVGTGLTLVGGDSTDPDGTLDDFIAFDFDDDTSTGRMGIVLPGEAETIVNGVLTIGSATATVYNDFNRFLVFPKHLVGAGALGMDIGMSNASNDINLTAYTLKGLGNATVKQFFDTALEVNGTTEVITIPGHGFDTGDLVTYSNEGGTNLTGLTTGTQYFVRAISVDTLSLYAIGSSVGRQNSFTDTTRVGLTADTAPGANHSLTRDPDNRFDYTVTGTTGVGHTLTSCTLDGARVITFTSKASMIGGFILASGNVDISGGSLTGVNVSSATLEEGAALFDPFPFGEFANLSGMTFTASDEGHAIRVTTVGSVGWDHTLSGYWDPADLGWNFDNSQAFTSEQIVMDAAHGFATGDAVYYNDEGGTTQTNLTDGEKYYVNVVNTTTVTLHDTKAAAVAGSSAKNMVTGAAQTHSLYSSKAAVFNDTASGTLTISVSGGTAPSVRNAPGATTVVNADVTVTFDGMRDLTEVRVYAAGTKTELAGIENATAGSPDNRSFAASVAASTSVDYTLVNVNYEIIRVEGFTWPAADQTILVQQRFDRNNFNP